MAVVQAFLEKLKLIYLTEYMGLTVLVIVIVFWLEKFFFVTKPTYRHYWFGLLYFLVNAFILGVLNPITSFYVAKAIQVFNLGVFDLRSPMFNGVTGSLLALLVTTLILDLFYYWFHRTLHESPILWQTHVLHHSDENMNMLTAKRGHVFEGLLAPFFIALPMSVLFKLPAVKIAYLSMIPQLYLFFAHANIRLGFGPFWWLLISPDYHRIHHSIEPRHQNKNFTNWFPIWDILFGTLYRPGRKERPVTGVKGVRVQTLLDAYMLPLYGWHRMFRQYRKRIDPR